MGTIKRRATIGRRGKRLSNDSTGAILALRHKPLARGTTTEDGPSKESFALGPLDMAQRALEEGRNVFVLKLVEALAADPLDFDKCVVAKHPELMRNGRLLDSKLVD